MIGSHLDSVADAGRYDGILGILIGLERRRAAADAALEVVAFADEDGLRFQSIYLGSRASSASSRPRNSACATSAGSRCARRSAASSAPPLYDPRDARAYLEVHIEQGPCSSPRGSPLGVVTAIAGQSRFNLAFNGHAGHAGTTPMHLRRDAAAAAAEFVLAAERIALRRAGAGRDGRRAQRPAWRRQRDPGPRRRDARHPPPGRRGARARDRARCGRDRGDRASGAACAVDLVDDLPPARDAVHARAGRARGRGGRGDRRGRAPAAERRRPRHGDDGAR